MAELAFAPAAAAVDVSEQCALALLDACSSAMDGHRWGRDNVAAARSVLSGEPDLLFGLARALGRDRAEASGWVVATLPPGLDDEALMVAAAGVLAGVGTPFYSIRQGSQLWIGGESAPDRDASSFGGIGAQGLHIDAPNVQFPPEHVALLMLRPDPSGGGDSLVGDLRAAVAELSAADAAALAEPVWFEGRAEDLSGVGEALLPFPVLDAESGWIRFAAKVVADARNAGCTGPAEHLVDLLEAHTTRLRLRRGQVLITNQRRAAHGRTALGPQEHLGAGNRRWIAQAKTTFDPDAPAWPVRWA